MERQVQKLWVKAVGQSELEHNQRQDVSRKHLSLDWSGKRDGGGKSEEGGYRDLRSGRPELRVSSGLIVYWNLYYQNTF